MLCAIPIETTIRELDGAVYQALHLAARGLPSLIGERMVSRIVMSAGEPVTYLDNDHDARDNEAILNAGGGVINIHPEGLNIMDNPHILSKFVDICPKVSTLCAWGEAQADLIRNQLPSDQATKVTATGHPSFDLTTAQFNDYFLSQDIVGPHGKDYTLINTNFSYYNHMMGFDKYIEMVKGSIDIFSDADHIRLVEKLADYQRSLLGPFMEMTRAIAAAFPDRHVIIRPHPVESSAYYEESLSGLSNVFVKKNGSVREWIASSGTVIHHDCTTGIESLLMGKPTIQYRPVFDGSIAASIPALAGTHAFTPDDVVSIIRDQSIPEDDVASQRQALEPYFSNVKINAAKTIADIASEQAKGKETWVPSPLGIWEDLKCWRKYASKLIRARQPGHNGRKLRHALTKFSRLHMADITGRIEKLRRIEPDLPPVTIERICMDTFVITPE